MGYLIDSIPRFAFYDAFKASSWERIASCRLIAGVDRPPPQVMKLIGHVLADDAGRFLSVDTGFSAIMSAPITALVGRTIMEITVPEDRPDTAARIDWLRIAETPFTIRKRYLRDDGSLAWVENHVALLRDGVGPVRIIATITQLSPPPLPHFPGDLLQTARLLLESRRRRDRAFLAELFSDPAWDMLLAIYVCEAEGRVLTVQALCDASHIGASVAVRWARMLLDSG
jgi:PAS domain S-box-containing protein